MVQQTGRRSDQETFNLIASTLHERVVTKGCDAITKFLRTTIHASNSNSTDALTFVNLRRMK